MELKKSFLNIAYELCEIKCVWVGVALGARWGLSFTVVFPMIFTHKPLFNVDAKWSFNIEAAYV